MIAVSREEFIEFSELVSIGYIEHRGCEGETIECENCGGSGQVVIKDKRFSIQIRDCPFCHGDGQYCYSPGR